MTSKPPKSLTIWYRNSAHHTISDTNRANHNAFPEAVMSPSPVIPKAPTETARANPNAITPDFTTENLNTTKHSKSAIIGTNDRIVCII